MQLTSRVVLLLCSAIACLGIFSFAAAQVPPSDTTPPASQPVASYAPVASTCLVDQALMTSLGWPLWKHGGRQQPLQSLATQ